MWVSSSPSAWTGFLFCVKPACGSLCSPSQSSSQDAKSVITRSEKERNDFQLCFQGEKPHHSLAQGGSQCFQKSGVNWSQIWTLVNYKANFPINSIWNSECLLRFRGWWAAELPEIISIALDSQQVLVIIITKKKRKRKYWQYRRVKVRASNLDVQNAFKPIFKSATDRRDLFFDVFLTSYKKPLHLLFYLFFNDGIHTQEQWPNFPPTWK